MRRSGGRVVRRERLALFLLGLASLIYVVSEIPDNGWASPATLGFGAAGALLLALFVLVERRSPAPLVPLEALRERSVVGALNAEGESGDLRPAQEAEAGVDEPDAAVGVLDHAPHVIKPPGISLREGRQDQTPQERDRHLAAVRVAGELQVEAPGRGAHVGEVRLVG